MGRGSRGRPRGCWCPRVPLLADSSAEAIDGSTLSFLLQCALGEEEEEAVEAAELVDLEEKLAAAEERLLEVLRRDRDELTRVTRQTWSTLSRVEQLAVHWFLVKDAVEKRREKRKKKEENDEVGSLAPGRVPVLLLFMTSLTILPSVFGWFLQPLVSGSHLFYLVLA